MHAAIEDDHGRPADGLAIDHARDIGAGRPTRKRPGSRSSRASGQQRIVRPAGGELGEPTTEPAQVERFLVRLVRDAEPTAGIDEPERRADAQRQAAGRPDRRRDVAEQCAGIEDVRRAERVEAQQVEVRRPTAPLGRLHEIGRVHPELAGAVVADQPDPFEAGVLGDGGAEHDRLDPTEPRGDRLEPRQLAG